MHDTMMLSVIFFYQFEVEREFPMVTRQEHIELTSRIVEKTSCTISSAFLCEISSCALTRVLAMSVRVSRW